MGNSDWRRGDGRGRSDDNWSRRGGRSDDWWSRSGDRGGGGDGGGNDDWLNWGGSWLRWSGSGSWSWNDTDRSTTHHHRDPTGSNGDSDSDSVRADVEIDRSIPHSHRSDATEMETDVSLVEYFRESVAGLVTPIHVVVLESDFVNIESNTARRDVL